MIFVVYFVIGVFWAAITMPLWHKRLAKRSEYDRYAGLILTFLLTVLFWPASLIYAVIADFPKAVIDVTTVEDDDEDEDE